MLKPPNFRTECILSRLSPDWLHLINTIQISGIHRVQRVRLQWPNCRHVIVLNSRTWLKQSLFNLLKHLVLCSWGISMKQFYEVLYGPHSVWSDQRVWGLSGPICTLGLPINLVHHRLIWLRKQHLLLEDFLPLPMYMCHTETVEESLLGVSNWQRVYHRERLSGRP